MKNKLNFLLLGIIFMCILSGFYGCAKQKKEVYVPSKWTTMEYVKEITLVWFINNKEIDYNNKIETRKIVARIWEADRDGKTQEEIEKSFKTRKLQDIIDNGI